MTVEPLLLMKGLPPTKLTTDLGAAGYWSIPIHPETIVVVGIPTRNMT